ncbi:MAG TPA: M81 family metallopeptidase [Chitinophagaceae bacterium]|nr:M81 family metallopeptidase [Chitinophagaceae bacterium]
MRVALMGIVHESNSFVNELTTLDHFRKGHWLYGNDIVREYKDAFHEIGGMLAAMDQAGIEVVPIMYAEATPGGKVSGKALEHLTHEMFSELKKTLPVDGCLVVPHGAGVSELYDDMDGYWLAMLRSIVGSDMPIIGTIDPHANVSDAMIRSTTALVAYKTNPHIDQRRTGKEAGDLMAGVLKGKIKPLQLFKQLPVAISIEQQLTDKDPCRELFTLASAVGDSDKILSTSIVLGFPYADVPEMGSSVIVIADGDEAIGRAALSTIVEHVIRNREQFNGVKQDINELIGSIGDLKKPVLLLDMGDNVGGGAPGDSTYLLDHLEDGGEKRSFICIYDPTAVQNANAFEPGMLFEISFGSRPDEKGIRSRTVELISKGSGKFSERAPRHGGQLHFDMGEIAILRTGTGHIVMLTSMRVPPFSLNQITSFGIDPLQFDTIVAKGVNAPIAAYREICPSILQVNTPGVTQADMTKFKYKKRRIPLFPFEDISEIQ